MTALDPARGGRFWPLLRPWLFLGAFGAVLVGALLFDSRLEYDPDVPPVRYGLHFAALMTGTTCVAAAWWARKRNQTWDSDVIPALLGGLGALVIAVSLHGTPFSLDGLHGDQAFRTAAITRFADSAALSDYTYRDLPAFYAPLFFWVLGRASVLLGVEPWRMLKLGTIAAAFIAPMVAYLCWRRLVPARIAALIAFVPFVVRGYGEPYGWLVRAVIIPWWLEAVHGMVREDLRPRHPIVLGLIGALLFATYYYYFFIFVIAYPLYLVIEGMRGDVDWRAVRRGLGILGITAIATAIYWAPLAWTMLTGPVATVSNRWLTMRHGEVRLPMIEPTVIGALCLLGVVFLAWTWREPLSRALAVITISLYVWHAIGFPLIMIDRPVLSFRMRELVPVVLLSAGAIALPRVVAFAESMVRDVRVARVSAILAVVLAVALTTGHVRETVADPQFANARKTARPHEARDESVSAEQVKSTIDAFYRGNEPPVVLSARTDVMALYPYYGFIQWVAYYSHPSAQYSERLAFLLELARSRSAQEFAERAGRNAFDAIDAFVLRVEGDELVYSTWVDNFPRRWSKQVDVRFPASLLDPRHFHLSRLDGYVVAVANRR